MYTSGKIRVVVYYGIERKALESLQDGGNRAVRHLQALDYPGDCTILEKVGFRRILHSYVGLGDAGDEHFAFLGVLDEFNGFIPAYSDWENRAWEEHCIAKCKHWKDVRKSRFIYLLEAVSLHYRDDADFRSGRKSIFFISHNCQNVSKWVYNYPRQI